VLLGLAALGVIAWPFARGMRLRERVVQGVLLAVAVGLAARGILGDLHPAWVVAVLLPVVAALPLPGRPRNGGVVGYSAFAVATVVVTHAVFFGEDRYHMVVTPALCVLAACALRGRGGQLGAREGLGVATDVHQEELVPERNRRAQLMELHALGHTIRMYLIGLVLISRDSKK
jgi:hypothetical protein